MKALLLVPLLLLAGCITVPPGTPVRTYYVIQQPYPAYETRVIWSIGIGYSRGYYRPGPWRHHRHW